MNPNPFPKPVGSVTGTSGGAIYPDNHGNLNLTGAGGTTVAGSGNTLTITSSGATGVTWQTVTGGPVSMASNNGYIVIAGTPSFTLPSSPNLGDILYVMLGAGPSWTITIAGGQTILLGKTAASSVIGTTGTQNSIYLICTIAGASSTWEAMGATNSFNAS